MLVLGFSCLMATGAVPGKAEDADVGSVSGRRSHLERLTGRLEEKMAFRRVQVAELSMRGGFANAWSQERQRAASHRRHLAAFWQDERERRIQENLQRTSRVRTVEGAIRWPTVFLADQRFATHIETIDRAFSQGQENGWGPGSVTYERIYQARAEMLAALQAMAAEVSPGGRIALKSVLEDVLYQAKYGSPGKPSFDLHDLAKGSRCSRSW
jgi:hypothetical protein